MTTQTEPPEGSRADGEPAVSAASASPAADWRDCWYPVGFALDLDGGAPQRFSVHDEAFVVFRDHAGAWGVLEDRCPHRAARLSDGRVVEGRLECLYHGWQFGVDGRCQRVPQLRSEQAIPERAHVRSLPVVERQGIVWVWPGERALADEADVPAPPGVDDPRTHCVDFVMDLPYDQSMLVENVIDVAHIHIAHDGMRGGGRRALAAPLEFETSEIDARGFTATYATVGRKLAVDSGLVGAKVEFVAPGFVHYTSEYTDPTKVAGLALFALPLGSRRCRLLYRGYSNFGRWRDRVRPRWLEHWTQCLILEQDMQVVVGQHEEMRGATEPLSDLWLPLKSSDTLVVKYRQWLDRFAASWPEYIGFRSSRRPEGDQPTDGAAVRDRRGQHVAQCRSCTVAVRRFESVHTGAGVAVVLALAVAAVTSGTLAAIAAGGAVVALATRLGAARARRCFD